jgi:hypothetical protein
MIDEMMREMPEYIVLARPFRFVGESMAERARECESFWLQHGAEIPGCYRLFRIIALFSASSGAAERLISFFNATIGMLL